MQVVKRDGRREDVAFEKVQQRITKAATGLVVNATKVAQGVLARIVDGITTTELDNITANLAYSWTTTHPDYGVLAGRIAVSNHQKNTPNTLLEVMECLAAVKDRTGAPASLIDPELLRVVRENASLIESYIDYERDFNLDFFGFKTLEKAYLLRDTDRKVVERPQHLWMRVALGLWLHDLPQAFVTYDLMSKKYYTHATPTLFNAGTKRPQLSSCFLAGTPVHTMNGVKFIEDVIVGDEVVTHNGNVKKVLQCHKNVLNDRKIFDIKIAGTPGFSVTDNHRLWSISAEQEAWGQSPGWNSVGYLRTGDWVAIPHKKGGAPVTIDVKTVLDKIKGDGHKISYEFSYDDEKVYPVAKWSKTLHDGRVVNNQKKSAPFNRYWTFDDEFMELMGIWYGDGCVVHERNSARDLKPRAVNIVSFHNNTDLITFVTKMFYKKLGVEHVTVSKDHNNMICMSVNSVYIAMIFKEMFKSRFDGKRLPTFFNRLNYSQIRAFLGGITSSDGCVSKEGRVCIQLTNPPLVQDIFHLARSVGIPITMTLMSSRSKKITGRMSIPSAIIHSIVKKAYSDERVTECATVEWNQIREINGTIFMRLNQKKPSEKLPEYVYTLGVEDDHSYSIGGIIAENCFLLSMSDDSIRGIYKTLEDCALISQYGGGIGLHVSNIRAKGSLIRGTGGISNGLVPMLRVFNNTARYVDQCFVPETIIITREGDKPICEINEGDWVLTCGGSETIEESGKHYVATNGEPYCKVLKRVSHVYNGVILNVKFNNNASVTVTPSHPFLTRSEKGEYDYVEIGKLSVFSYIVGPNGLTQITSIDSKNVENITVYDLEIDGTHDYCIKNVGFAHNGGGKRNGSFAMYLEPWHADVEDFLEMKKNTGAEEERARDLFYAMWVPDLFMERVDANGDWTLFCPNEAPGLADVVGDDFKALYERYETEGRGKKTIKAQKLWFQILDSQIETGTPYLLYKDAANLKSNQQNLGVIKSSNLCVAPETVVLTKHGEFAIKTLVDCDVEVWNGEKWSKTIVHKTGVNQPLICLQIEDNVKSGLTGIKDEKIINTIYTTKYHKFILSDNQRVCAADLKSGQHLCQWTDPYGNLHTPKIIDIVDEGRIDDTYCFNEPENHAGVFNGVLTGNCTEIIEYSSPTETAVCNLASMSLPAFVKNGAFDFKHFREVVQIVVKNLNRVIDINYYPVPEAERSNKRHRPIGLGVQGLSDVFAMLNLPWESEGASILNKRIFAHMYYAACVASVDLAAHEGRYETYTGSPMYEGKFQFDLWNAPPLVEDGLDWDNLANDARRIGMRNSLLIAPMPTASTSQILGNCECIEPYATHIFTRRTLAGEFIVLNKHLVAALLAKGLWTTEMKDAIIGNNGSVAGLPGVPEDIQRVFKTVWEIKQKALIDMAADRGPYICQSQSLNLFMGDPDYKKLSSMHFYAWRKGLKTGIYYLRTRAVASAQKFTVEPVTAPAPVAAPPPAECLMCSS